MIFDTRVYIYYVAMMRLEEGGEGGYIEQVRNEEQGMGNDD